MRHRFAFLTTFITILALMLGNLVVATNSGDACGTTYPQCNGQWIPDFTINVAIEYSHRVFTMFLGFFILINSILAWRRRYPGEKSVKILAPLTSFFLLLQAATGGVNVVLSSPPGFTTLDVNNSLLLLVSLVFLAVALKRYPINELEPQHIEERRKLKIISTPSLIVFLLLFFEIILGAFFKHSRASKISFGQEPDKLLFESPLIADTIYMFHTIMAVVVVVYAFWFLFYALKAQMLVIPAMIVMVLVILNGVIGMLAHYMDLANWSSSLHMFTSIVTLAVISYILAKAYLGFHYLIPKQK
ncbi:COX15/CtaA family protein [Evansella clarkii]|jgi:cytochrome c oxidase assembly protein subunit 15|uniref:COX15/CtaA family protein n=1 Tax=Evansella clarkii TaxID=79879 RepID=UPI0014742E48|nr:COX15/CtaA family protein [Evansella clarkii]